jgi:hypothetical protein
MGEQLLTELGDVNWPDTKASTMSVGRNSDRCLMVVKRGCWVELFARCCRSCEVVRKVVNSFLSQARGDESES